MPRSKNGTRRRERRRKIMKLAKGYWGGRSRLFKTAKESVMKGLASSYRDRRRKKRDFRRLWIARISAAVRAEGVTYSQFIHGLAEAEVMLNRKALSNMAIEDPVAFKAIVAKSREALATTAATAGGIPAGGIPAGGVPAAGVGAK
jgi:large subunit ribosomal protein L20